MFIGGVRMKKTLFTLLLLTTSLVSCSGVAGLTGEKLYRVYSNDGYYIRVYSDSTTDYLTFNNGVLVTTTYAPKGYEYSSFYGKRELYTIANAYFNASSNLIYINSDVVWYTVYNFKTREECTDQSDLRYFVKQSKPTTNFYLWGEYGDGWVKVDSGTSLYPSVLYVTERYAKKVGIKTITYTFNTENNTYVSSDGNNYYY